MSDFDKYSDQDLADAGESGHAAPEAVAAELAARHPLDDAVTGVLAAEVGAPAVPAGSGVDARGGEPVE